MNASPRNTLARTHARPWRALVLAALATTLPQAVRAVTPPDLPAAIAVPAGNVAYLEGHAVGTQGYVCIQKSDGTFAWSFFGPDATLFNDGFHQILTHFLGTSPADDAPHPAWQSSRDSSRVYGTQQQSVVVDSTAIPWLLLGVSATEAGPTGGNRLGTTTYIQRVDTTGGKAPATGCTTAGARALVPYTANYFFYRAAGDDGD